MDRRGKSTQPNKEDHYRSAPKAVLAIDLGSPMESIRECIEGVLFDNVPGDFVECGVWRGGSCIFARSVFDAHGASDRNVWVADSFEGMPKITSAKDKVDADYSGEGPLPCRSTK
jgi:hypothetical protein